MEKGTNGSPDPGQLKTFVTDAENPVDLQIGPNGDLFYVDFDQRNDPPHPVRCCQPTPHSARDGESHQWSDALAVNFDGTPPPRPGRRHAHLRLGPRRRRRLRRLHLLRTPLIPTPLQETTKWGSG